MLRWGKDVRLEQRASQNARRTFALHTKQRTLPSDSRAMRRRRACLGVEDHPAALRTHKTRPCRYERSCERSSCNHLIPRSRRVRAFAYLSGVWFPKERDAKSRGETI